MDRYSRPSATATQECDGTAHRLVEIDYELLRIVQTTQTSLPTVRFVTNAVTKILHSLTIMGLLDHVVIKSIILYTLSVYKGLSCSYPVLNKPAA